MNCQTAPVHRYKAIAKHILSFDSRRQSALTDSDLTDAAVEGPRGDIVAAAAGLTLYRRRRDHIVLMVQNW